MWTHQSAIMWFSLCHWIDDVLPCNDSFTMLLKTHLKIKFSVNKLNKHKTQYNNQNKRHNEYILLKKNFKQCNRQHWNYKNQTEYNKHRHPITSTHTAQKAGRLNTDTTQYKKWKRYSVKKKWISWR